MLSLTLTPISSSTFPCSRTPPPTSTLTTNLNKPFYYYHHHQIDENNNNNRAKGLLICRAGLLSDDGPFIVAIGSSMLSSLFLATPDKDDDDAETVVGFTDTRFGVMGIISFIPFFNWLSWVFAWLDTQERRYAVYAIVYLLPYLRSNLSLSPEESWLPIASIIFCILHVQLEASIRNGDLQGFQLFNMVAKQLSSVTKTKANHSKGRQEMTKEERKGEDMNLPQAKEQSSNDIRQWRVPQKPSEHPEDLNGDGDNDKSGKQ
ncbi:hypothetical protein LWI28_016797 [Acer negundo]|uniref:Uncharacterized protein n=1 Tax=Acer negundo TaxID=4023 RepID=A0AAD5IQI6_ACENE|nr:hypothetical protein LWI28_016797 [Acer negundo]